MLDANSQLSRLVKAALAGEEVIIASRGKVQVKFVQFTSAAVFNRVRLIVSGGTPNEGAF